MQSAKHHHRLLSLPQSRAGKLAASLLVAHVLLMLTAKGLVASGELDSAFNPTVMTPYALAGFAAAVGGVLAVYAVIVRHERSIFLWAAMLPGLFLACIILTASLM